MPSQQYRDSTGFFCPSPYVNIFDYHLHGFYPMPTSSQHYENSISSLAGVTSPHVSADLGSLGFIPAPFAPTSAVGVSFVSPSSQWSVSNDGAWYPNTGATHHVIHTQSNLQAGTPSAGQSDSESVARKEAHS
ncbi:uncharacterized protein LOC120144035 [Hibiscus syriacus]|uniref:uncharacterized protein LOC120144035 n=1 Tax=Hibiscus syriacus TaxID=106335 RepID=UPI001920AA89|nr:uncharacterized protein LOC120144035 [Hibiscus syriacus]